MKISEKIFCTKNSPAAAASALGGYGRRATDRKFDSGSCVAKTSPKLRH